SAFAAAELGGWRVAAASDWGAVGARFDTRAWGGLADASGQRLRMEVQAARAVTVAGAPLAVDFGLSHVHLDTNPYRREDGLWAAGPQGRRTTASLGVALHRESGGLAPYARIAEPVSGAGEAWRLVGVRMGRPQARFGFDAMLGEIDDPFARTSIRAE